MDVKSGAIRVITGSYEHNLLCVALNNTPKGTIFVPIFHFAPHTQSIRCVASSKRWLVSGSNDEIIRLYDLQRRREVGTLIHHSGQILCLEFFHAKWLLSGGGDGKICIWRVKDWELLGELKGHKAAVADIAIHPTGKVALSVGDDRRLFLWNLMTGHKASIQKLADTPRKVVWIPGGNRFVIGYDRKVCWCTSATKPDLTVELSSGLQHLAYSDDNHLVVGLNDGSIVIYKDGEVVNTHKGHKTRVKHFAFLGDIMASISSDGAIVVWDTKKWEEIAVYDASERLNCVCLVPDDVEKYTAKETKSEDTTDNESENDLPAPPAKKKKRKTHVQVIEG